VSKVIEMMMTIKSLILVFMMMNLKAISRRVKALVKKKNGHLAQPTLIPEM